MFNSARALIDTSASKKVNGTALQWIIAVCAIVSLLAAMPQAWSQVTSGTITGTVKDSTGAVIPNATVTARESATGVVRQVQASSIGIYNIPGLPPGAYRLSATAAGFSLETSEVNLTLNQELRFEFHLQPGASTQQITVNADQLTLETQSHEVSDDIDAHAIENLPTQDGSIFETLTSAANVNSFNMNGQGTKGFPPKSIVETMQSNNSSLTTGGLTYGTTSYLEDGVQNTDLMTESANLQPNVEATQEVNVITNSGSVRFDEPSVVNVITKSGTNAFHGTAYDYLRNDALDAIGYVLAQKPPTRYNQFGANIGGPILRNKFFFFFDYGALRDNEGTTFIENLPTAAERTGDFSADATIYDPATYNPTTGTISAFPQNKIDPQRISNFAKLYFAGLPLPNGSTVANENYQSNVANSSTFTSYVARVDYNLGPKDTILAEYQTDNPKTLNAAFMPQLWNYNINLSGTNTYLQETHAFSSRVSNVVRAGYNRGTTSSAFVSTGTQNFVAEYGIQNLNPAPQLWIPPKVAIKSHSNEGNPNFPISALQNLFQYADETDWTAGHHSLYFGGEMDRIQYNGAWGNYNNGLFTFTGQYTSNHKGKLQGNDIADLLLDYPQQATGGIGSAVGQFREYNVMPYFGDDWKATQKLTVNLGLRYDYREAPGDKNGNSSVYDLQSNTNHSGTFRQTYLNFAPRAGFAYSLGDNTVINGGYGIYYVSFMYYDLESLLAHPPNFTLINTTNPVTTPIKSEDQFPASAPLSNQSPLTMQLNLKMPYVQQWNVSIQRSFGSDWMAKITYAGNRSTHQVLWHNANQAALPTDPTNPSPLQTRRPYSYVADVEEAADMGFANYNGLAAELRHNYRNGLSLLANFVYSRSLDDVDSDQETPEHGMAPDLDYGLSRFDQKFVFKISPIFELPFGKNERYLNGGKWFENQLGGWQISSVVTANSGFPFSVVATDNSDTGGDHDQRADQVCDGIHVSNRTFNHWFDTSCYVQPGPGELGNERRNNIYAPRNVNVNLSMFKSFPFRENGSVQFRSDFFSAFNHPLPQYPDNIVSDSTYGQIILFNGARVIQFSLKVSF